MKKFIQSFKDKKFKAGAYSVLSLLMVLAILLAVNLAASRLDARVDLTRDKLYSLSGDSISLIKELDTDVTIYALFRTGEENTTYKELLEQYKSNSSNIRLEYRDPYLYPQFANQYASDGQTISENSIIVENKETQKYKVILAEELVTTTFDYYTWQQSVTSIDLEPQVTNAILYVAGEEAPVIYMVNNHGEESLPESIAKQIKLANYELKYLDLLREGTVPEDCGILVATTPQRDWTKEEVNLVRAYLDNEGRALLMVDPLTTTGSIDNLNSLINSYGLNIGKGFIVEGDRNNYYSNQPTYLVPNYVRHDITETIIAKKYMMFLYPASSLDILDVKMESLTIEPLLMTSQASFQRLDFTNGSAEMIPGDLSGPFMLAAAVTDNTYDTVSKTTKLVAVACGQLISEALNTEINGTNGDFILGSINWLNDSSDKVSIRSKSISGETAIDISTAMEDQLFYGSVIVLPLLIVGIGLYIWYRRRYS